MHNRSNYSPVHFGQVLEGLMNRDFSFEAKQRHIASVNIKEDADKYELHLAAPGLQKEDFKISVEKNTLSLSYDKQEETKESSEKWLRQEYKMSSFKRNFSLNDKIDAAGISAQYDNGVLVVTLPKKEKEEPKTVSISVQ
jgi:HSP20 family protein